MLIGSDCGIYSVELLIIKQLINGRYFIFNVKLVFQFLYVSQHLLVLSFSTSHRNTISSISEFILTIASDVIKFADDSGSIVAPCHS